MTILNTSRDLTAIMTGIVESVGQPELQTAFKATATHLETIHQSYFDFRAGPSGQAWEPWHFSGLDTPDHQTLEVSKTLRNSLKVGRTGNVTRISSNTLMWGTNISYGKTHNFGARIVTTKALISRDGKIYLPAGSTLNIPQREFFGMAEKHIDVIESNLFDAIIDQLIERLRLN